MHQTDCPHRDDVILTKAAVQSMKNEIHEIRKLLDLFIESVDQRYARKSDLAAVRRKVQSLDVVRFFVEHPRLTVLIMAGLYLLAIADVRQFLLKIF